MRFPLLTTLSALAVLTACSPASVDEPLERGVHQLTTTNGSNLNGSNLNGSNLNGSNLNGSNLNGQALNETLVHVKFAGARVSVNGKSVLDEARLDGTVFWGRKGNSVWTGADFLNGDFEGVRGDGTTTRVRIDSVNAGTAPASDVWTYGVSYQAADGTWWPVCKDATGPTVAIPVNGRWDYRNGVPTGGSKTDDPATFTFACRGTSAIAKCVDMGYKPWLSSTVADHHQSCTRLLRADFCGDGTSYTTNGQWVNLYDAIGIQSDTEDWVLESEWDTAGARCFSPLNRSHETVPCYDSLVSVGCGTFQTGTLLMNETPTDGILN